MTTRLPRTPAVFYFDIISPWAYLMDVALRREPLPVETQRRPLLFAGLLNTFGNKGPAEIERKRRFTYEMCTWTAQQQGIPFLMPAVHPFNPLRYLRLILALGGTPHVISAVFDHLYTSGCDPDSQQAWLDMLDVLRVTEASVDLGAPLIKALLKENTAAAAAQGVFGVPTVTVADKLFWGLDSLPMLRAFLSDDPELKTPAMRAAAQVRFGASR